MVDTVKSLKSQLQSGGKANPFWIVGPCVISEDALVVEARELVEENSVQQLLVKNSKGVLSGVIHVYDLLKKKVI